MPIFFFCDFLFVVPTKSDNQWINSVTGMLYLQTEYFISREN